MNSIHDLGGMHGMGKLPFENNEPAFHAEWERTTFGINMVLQMAGVYLPDEHRYSMEEIPALEWLAASYYEHWIDGIASILIAKGYATPEEVATGKVDHARSSKMPPAAVRSTDVRPFAFKNHPVTREVSTAPLFKVGDKVRAKNLNPRTHTRLPRYVRGRVGTVASYSDAFLYADIRAHGGSEEPEHTYSVRFEAAELWGPEGGPRDALFIDLYQPYIEAA